MLTNVSYDSLPENEKVALKVAVLYPHRSIKEALTELLDVSQVDSGLYRSNAKARENLKRKGILDRNEYPKDVAFKILPHSEARQLLKELNREVRRLVEHYKETLKLKHQLEEENRKLLNYEVLKNIPKDVQENLDNSIKRLNEGSCREAIVNAGLVCEELTGNLFALLYGDQDFRKTRKWGNRIKRIWNDEKMEKHKYEGIHLVASLFATVMWYRNKMGAHPRGFRPTFEAARLCVIASIRGVYEMQRLGVF